ncbi:putative membrane protein [Escherichia coli DEC10C]|nr:putative membrane protein [Escherichia coli DEC10C]
MFYKLCLLAVVILLLVMVMMDFTCRIMLVLTDGALVCGIVVLLWPMMKEQNE